MVLLLALIIGVGAGLIGARLFPRNLDYLLFNVLAGVIGAIIGLAVYVLALRGGDTTVITVSGTLSTILGAVLIELLFVFAQSIPKKKKKSEV